MRRWFALALAGLVAFVVTLVVTVPAPQAYRLVDDAAPVTAWGVYGTVREGGASVVVVDGVRIDALRWRLVPSALLRARLAMEIEGRVADGEFSGRASTRTGARVRVTDLRATIGADALVRLLSDDDYPARLGGRLDALIESLVVAGQRPEVVEGIVNWRGASVSGFGETVALGGFGVRLATGDDDTVRGTLRDTDDGPLRVRGDARLALDGTLTGETRVEATDAASPELLQGMRLIGIPDPEASLTIRFEGNINNPAGFRGRLQ